MLRVEKMVLNIQLKTGIFTAFANKRVKESYSTLFYEVIGLKVKDKLSLVGFNECPYCNNRLNVGKRFGRDRR